MQNLGLGAIALGQVGAVASWQTPKTATEQPMLMVNMHGSYVVLTGREALLALQHALEQALQEKGGA